MIERTFVFFSLFFLAVSSCFMLKKKLDLLNRIFPLKWSKSRWWGWNIKEIYKVTKMKLRFVTQHILWYCRRDVRECSIFSRCRWASEWKSSKFISFWSSLKCNFDFSVIPLLWRWNDTRKREMVRWSWCEGGFGGEKRENVIWGEKKNSKKNTWTWENCGNWFCTFPERQHTHLEFVVWGGRRRSVLSNIQQIYLVFSPLHT